MRLALISAGSGQDLSCLRLLQRLSRHVSKQKYWLAGLRRQKGFAVDSPTARVFLGAVGT